MIRDRHEGDSMARLMSIVTAVFLLVPIVAPSIGAGLIAVLFAVNALNNARLVRRFGAVRLLRGTATLVTLGSLAFLAVSLLDGGEPNFWLFVVAMTLVVLAAAMIRWGTADTAPSGPVTPLGV